MRVILEETDLKTAIAEYLQRRGIDGVTPDSNITFVAKNDEFDPDEIYTDEDYYFTADIGEVKLVPKDGPYR
jgi:hypothetical protein